VESFVKRVQSSWQGVYDVREREVGMVMQSAFTVRYESYLSGWMRMSWLMLLLLIILQSNNAVFPARLLVGVLPEY
jgi:hypothetical protein